MLQVGTPGGMWDSYDDFSTNSWFIFEEERYYIIFKSGEMAGTEQIRGWCKDIKEFRTLR